MICNTCGRNIQNEEANFCEYCGNSFREHVKVTEGIVALQNKVNEEQEKPVSFLNWLGSMSLIFIPYVGIFAYIIMMFIWAFGSKTPKSKKNWARVALIRGGVMFLLFIVIMVIMMNSMMKDPNFMNYFNELQKTYQIK